MVEGILQIYVEVEGYDQALTNAGVLIAQIQELITVKNVQIEPYWKIKEYFGITLKLEGKDLVRGFDALLNHLAFGWHPIHKEENTCWAVWNPSETAQFMNSAVRWANLELWLSADQTIQA